MILQARMGGQIISFSLNKKGVFKPLISVLIGGEISNDTVHFEERGVFKCLILSCQLCERLYVLIT